MDIQLPLASLLPQRPEIKGLPRLIADLKPGRDIVVVVDSQLSENDYLLRLTGNGLQLRARTPQNLQPGQTLQLRVEQGGETPRLKIMAASPPESPVAQAVRQATREFLPKSLPVRAMLDALPLPLPRAETVKANLPALPPVIGQALERLAQTLPPAQKLMSAEGVQRSLQASGLLFEAKAAELPAQLTEMAQSDFKARLMAVATLLRQQIETMESDKSPASSAPGDEPKAADALPIHVPSRPMSGEERAPSAELVQAAPPKAVARADRAGPSPAPVADAQPEAATPLEGEPPNLTAPKEQQATENRPLAIYAEIEEIPSVLIEDDNPADTVVVLDVEGSGASSVTDDLAAPQGRESAETLPHADSGTSSSLTKPAGSDPVATAHPSRELQAASGQAPGMDEVVGGLADRLHELKGLLHKLEGGLASIVLAQLSSLPSEQGQQVWQFEVPYFTGQGTDVAQFNVTRDGGSDSDSESSQAFWSVNLSLHPPGLGDLHARITLINGRIDSYLWSESEATSGLIGSHLDWLGARLQQAGLNVGRLEALANAPAQTTKTIREFGGGLLDEKV